MDLLGYFESQIATLQAAKDQYIADLQMKYDEGYAAGKASVVLPGTGTGTLLFTQEDMDAVALTAKAEKAAELQPQIDAAVAEVAVVKAAGEQAVVDLKKDVAAKIRNASIDDMAIAAELEA